jgi:Ca2+/H+ antiporter
MFIEAKIRNLKNYFLMLIPFVIINLIIIIMQDNSLKQNIQNLISSFSAYKTFTADDKSLSFVSSARNLIRISSDILDFNAAAFTEVITRNSIFISFILLIIYLFFVRFCKSILLEYKYLFGTMTLWLIVPTTFVYTTVLIIPVCAFIVYNNLSKHNQSEKQSQSTNWKPNSFKEIVLLLAILVTLMPAVWLYDGINLKFTIQNLLWIISFMSFVIYQFRINIKLKEGRFCLVPNMNSSMRGS